MLTRPDVYFELVSGMIMKLSLLVVLGYLTTTPREISSVLGTDKAVGFTKEYVEIGEAINKKKEYTWLTRRIGHVFR